MITHVVPSNLIPSGISLEIQGPSMGCEDGAILDAFLAENDFVLQLVINPITGGNAAPLETPLP